MFAPTDASSAVTQVPIFAPRIIKSARSRGSTPAPTIVITTPVEAEELLRALLDGPTQEGLVSPFPRGVAPNRVELREDGCLRIVLSEAYSGLSDIALTLADYAIVLTLSQLEGVESVEIQTVGYSSNYRSHQVLRPEEALISDPLQTGDSFA